MAPSPSIAPTLIFSLNMPSPVKPLLLTSRIVRAVRFPSCLGIDPVPTTSARQQRRVLLDDNPGGLRNCGAKMRPALRGNAKVRGTVGLCVEGDAHSEMRVVLHPNCAV